MGGSATSGKNYEWRAPSTMGYNGGKTSGAYNTPMQRQNPQGNAYGFRGMRPPQAQEPQLGGGLPPAKGMDPNMQTNEIRPGMYQKTPTTSGPNSVSVTQNSGFSASQPSFGNSLPYFQQGQNPGSGGGTPAFNTLPYFSQGQMPDTGFSPENNIPTPPPGMFQHRLPIADGSFDMSQVQNLPATMPQQAAPQRPKFSFRQPVQNLLGNTLNMRPRSMR